MNINLIQYFNSENFWLCFAFITLFAFSLKTIKVQLFSFLNKKIANTNKEIDAQEQLLFEIQGLYQELKKKADVLNEEISKIKKEVHEATKIILEEEKNKLSFCITSQNKLMEDNIRKIVNKKTEEILNIVIDAKTAIEELEEKEQFDKHYNKNIFKLLKSSNVNTIITRQKTY
jgi:F0F1-type ATP synthase membrane subunit b/b'